MHCGEKDGEGATQPGNPSHPAVMNFMIMRPDLSMA
eukprot:COSAG06_NODE_3291_length_5547_cov_263.463656_1_plen_36_part_00